MVRKWFTCMRKLFCPMCDKQSAALGKYEWKQNRYQAKWFNNFRDLTQHLKKNTADDYSYVIYV
eukprot:UN31739